MKVSNIRWVGGGAVFFAGVLWALNALLRTRLYGLPPLTIVFAEHAIGLVIVAPLLFVFRRKIKPLSREQKLSIVIVAALSGVIGTLLFTAALLRVNFDSFSVVILLQQLQPVFAIAAAAWLLKEQINARFIGLAILAMGGAYLLNFPDLAVNFDSGDAAVGLMAVGAAAAWGSSTALSKYSLRDTFWLHITALRFGLTTIISGAGLLVFSSTNAVGGIPVRKSNHWA